MVDAQSQQIIDILNNETCDDGNNIGGDQCSAICRPENCEGGSVSDVNGTCTFTFYPLKGDGYVGRIGDTGWSAARNSSTGTVASSGEFTFKVHAAHNLNTNSYTLHRAFIPFDTNPIPNNGIVTNAKLKIFANNSINTDINGDGNTSSYGFMVIVDAFQTDTNSLSSSEFNKIGPTEYTNRKFMTNFSTQYDFNFNYVSIINKFGITKLGLRTGYDLFNIPIGNGKIVGSNIYSSDNNSLSVKPQLTVTYRPA